MYRSRVRQANTEREHLDRWLVSYADYMTLMFALFVVLYALAMVKEEEYSVLSQSLTRLFVEPRDNNTGVEGLSVLTQTNAQSELDLYGTSLDEAKGTTLLADATTLSDVDSEKLGSPLITLEEHLTKSMAELIDKGLAKVQLDDNWLTIELSSGLLFASGSAIATSSANVLLKEITHIINPINNYIRVRGYTDNLPINNEIFASNWELSVMRAAAVLRILEQNGTASERLAIEGFGQYYPSVSNDSAQGRAANRKVVIAISRYGVAPLPEQKPEIDVKQVSEQQENTLEHAEQEDESIKVIALPGGGIRITTRKDNPDAITPKKQEP